MRIKNQKDFYAGLMFAVVGGAFAFGAVDYKVGSAARMGPGYFPLLLGIVMALIGLAILATGLSLRGQPPEADGRIGRWAWRPIVFILGANLVFGVLIGGLPSIGLPPMGMIVAIYALTFIASLAGREFDARRVFLLATALAAGSYVAFIWALELQIPAWPTFIAG